MQSIWYVLFGVMLGWVCTLSSGVIIGYMIFRTRHATTDIPFMRPKRAKKDQHPSSYVSDLFPEDELPEDEEMSEAAQRLHKQKDSRAAAMATIKGTR